MHAGPKHGWMKGLRRRSGAGFFVFLVVLLVGFARTEALALSTGDDALCIAMGGAARTVEPTDPSDLADRTHACCDLGQCRDGGALPSTAPEAHRLAMIVVGTRSIASRRRAVPARRRTGHRPRDPPAR